MHAIEVRMQAFVFDDAEVETILKALDAAAERGTAAGQGASGHRASSLAADIRGACAQ